MIPGWNTQSQESRLSGSKCQMLMGRGWQWENKTQVEWMKDLISEYPRQRLELNPEEMPFGKLLLKL